MALFPILTSDGSTIVTSSGFASVIDVSSSSGLTLKVNCAAGLLTITGTGFSMSTSIVLTLDGLVIPFVLVSLSPTVIVLQVTPGSGTYQVTVS